MSAPAEPLIDAAAEDRLHHALILSGPDGRELREAALRIAMALNCFGGKGEDECRSCRKIAQHIHPDVHLLEVESDRKMISIEQVRELVADASLKPYEGRNKVFIIDPVDAISLQGSNALLKTLEEPVPSTVFLLLTRSPDRLLPTIRSRSQIVPIRPRARFLPLDEASERGVSLQEARLFAASTGEKEGTEERELMGEIVHQLYGWASKRDTTALLALAALLGSSAEPGRAGGVYIAVMRDLLGTHPDDSIDPGRFEEIQQKIASEQLHDSARAMARCIDMLSVNVDPRNAFEGALLELIPRR